MRCSSSPGSCAPEPRFVARLVALIPLPRTKARRFHGVFAPNHRLRKQVVPRPPTQDQAGYPVAPQRPARMGWAERSGAWGRRSQVWNIDALRCSWCEGRLRVIAPISAVPRSHGRRDARRGCAAGPLGGTHRDDPRSALSGAALDPSSTSSPLGAHAPPTPTVTRAGPPVPVTLSTRRTPPTR